MPRGVYDRARVEDVAAEPVPEIIVAVAPDVATAAVTREERRLIREGAVMEMLQPFTGRGLQVSFDEHGAVTFQRGTIAESINMDANDTMILRTAQRVLTTVPSP